MKDKIRLIISALDSGGLGGSENFLLNLSNELKKLDVDTVFLSVKGQEFAKVLKKQNKTVTELPFRQDLVGDWKGFTKFFVLLPLAMFYYLKSLLDLKRQKYNTLLIPGFSDKLLLSPIAKILGFEVVWLEYAPLTPLFNKFFKIPKMLYRFVKDIPSTLLVASKNTKKHLISETGISESKMKVILLGITIISQSELQSIKAQGLSLRKTYEWEDKFVVGYISRIEKEKGQDELIKAVKLLNNKIPNLRLVIGGTGDTDYLRSIIKGENLKNIELLGFISESDKYALISSLDLFCFPTRWKLEGFGLVALEAMMVGTPLLSSSFGPVPEIVGNSGFVVSPRALEISKGIYKIYKYPKLQRKLADYGKKRVVNFNIENTAKSYLAIFESQLKI